MVFPKHVLTFLLFFGYSDRFAIEIKHLMISLLFFRFPDETALDYNATDDTTIWTIPIV